MQSAAVAKIKSSMTGCSLKFHGLTSAGKRIRQGKNGPRCTPLRQRANPEMRLDRHAQTGRLLRQAEIIASDTFAIDDDFNFMTARVMSARRKIADALVAHDRNGFSGTQRELF